MTSAKPIEINFNNTDELISALRSANPTRPTSEWKAKERQVIPHCYQPGREQVLMMILRNMIDLWNETHPSASQQNELHLLDPQEKEGKQEKVKLGDYVNSVSNSAINERLSPGDALFGGRTEAER
ncbi:hypothetical protein Anas_05869 [Armadillidium nasatum]|uniref:Uncharacterized protein n=1 Tax=Armadillidium nasatum TaxID=96803 RepID=A0A5N5SQX6_9CRUS|nr:hypothetical protein Anas_05869 [Armadillidium nasatum]